MKKRTSNVSRRIVSLLMSMVLTLTLVTPAAFATEVVGGSGTAIIEGNANPADANPNEDTEGKDDVDKNTENGKDEQPTEPGDEDKNPDEDNGDDASKPDGDSKDKENPDGDKKDEENKNEQPTEDENNGDDEIALLNAENAADAWDGTAVDTSWYAGHENETKFSIGTAAELAGLAKLVNDGTNFSGKTIKLTANIDLGDKEWTPIGNGDNSFAFSGTFDGNGNTISGLNVPDTNAPGLFGCIFGTVQNLIVKGNVTVDDNADGGDYGEGGGVVCDNNGTVQNCGFYGSVNDETGYLFVGGVAGGGSGKVLNCWYYMTDESSSVSVVSVCTATNCVVISSSGNMPADKLLATLQTNAPDTGKVWSWKADDAYPTLINPPKTITMQPVFPDCTAAVSANGTALTAANGYTYEVEEDAVITVSGNSDTLYYAASESEKDYTTKGENANLTELKRGTTFHNADLSKTYYYGTEEDFKLLGAWNSAVSGKNVTITEADQLKALARMVNSGKDSMTGKTIVLTADIDLNNQAWTPIGNENGFDAELAFSGTFNGDGYTVSGLNVPDTYFPGLFGQISTSAVVQNLIVKGSVTGGDEASGTWAEAAGVAAYNDGCIQNCGFYGTVTGSSDGSVSVYGLTGSMGGGTVKNCWYFKGVGSGADDVCGGTATNCVMISSSEPMDNGKLATLQTNAPKTGKVWSWKAGDAYPTLIDPPKTITMQPVFPDCTAVVSANGTPLSADKKYTCEVTEDSVVITVSDSSKTLYYAASEGENAYTTEGENANLTELKSGNTTFNKNDLPKTYYYGTEEDFQLLAAWNSALGRSGNTATVTTADRLKALARMVNSGKDSMTGKTITLGTNIVWDGSDWTPIGTEENPFKGTFTGYSRSGGYAAISGLSGDLFGVVDNNKTKIQYVTISGGTGRLVGELTSGTVQYCMSTAEVTDRAGGLVGQNSGTVDSCYYYNAGSKNTPAVGGGNSVTVTKCFYLADTSTFGAKSDIGARTAEEFKLGRVAYELGGYPYVWVYDTTKAEKMPQLGSAFTSTTMMEASELKLTKPDNQPEDVVVTLGSSGKKVLTDVAGNQYYYAASGYPKGVSDVPVTFTAPKGYQIVFTPATTKVDGKDYLRITGSDVEYTYSLIKADIGWYESHKTEKSYAFQNSDELVGLALLVNGMLGVNENFKDWTLSLERDIDLAGVNWIPIGQRNNFAGTFNGNNHAITGLSVVVATGYAGLFGNLTGTVQNLQVEGSVTASGKVMAVGGIVGYSAGGTVQNCLSKVNILASQVNYPVGGVVGESSSKPNDSTASSTVNLCWNEGTVTGGSGSTGGIVGTNSNGAVTNCANFGTVKGSSAAGGIVGRGTAANSYNLGNVTGAENTTYGISSRAATNSYYLCKLNGTEAAKYVNSNDEQDIATAKEDGKTVYKVSDDVLVDVLNKDENRGTYIEWINKQDAPYNPVHIKRWDGSFEPGVEGVATLVYDPNGGDGQQQNDMKMVVGNGSADFTVKSADEVGFRHENGTFLGWSTDPRAKTADNRYAAGKTVSVEKDKTVTLYAVWENIWTGSGTEADAYQISDAPDLTALQKQVNENGFSYTGKWFRLTNNIDLNNELWTPIGVDSLHFFGGSLDGGGKTISGLKVETDRQWAGLFGSVRGTYGVPMTMRDLTLKNGSVKFTSSGTSCSGGLVAIVEGETALELRNVVAENLTVSGGDDSGGLLGRGRVAMTNCHNRGGSVTGRYAGGLAGNGYSNLLNHVFTGCTNSAKVVGERTAGGMTGNETVSNGSYTSCANSGSISATQGYASGIAAGGSYKQCSNSGAVTGKQAAGITSHGNKATFCSNTGAITGTDYAAGILTNGGYGGTVEFCWNTGRVEASTSVRAFGILYGWGSYNRVRNSFSYVPGVNIGLAPTELKEKNVSDSYYLADKKDSVSSVGEWASADDFASGKVAWGVDGGVNAHKNYWTQGANNYPVPIGEGTSTSYYRAKAECGTGGAVSIKSSRNFTGDADNAVYGPKGMSVTVTATPKDDTFGLKSLTLDLMGTGSATALESGDSFTLGEANALVVATFASTGNGGSGGGTGGNGGDGDGTGTDTGDGAGDENDEGLQDGLNMDVEYNIKGLVLAAYAEWGANGGGKTFVQWLKASPSVLRAFITNSLDNMAAAAKSKDTDEAKGLAALLLASLNEHSGLDSKNGDIIAKALQRYMDTGSEATFSTWLTTGSGMASGTVEEILAQYTASLLDLTERLYTNWESSGTSLTFPVWLDAQQVTMESLSENAEEPEAEPDDTQTSEAPEDVPDGQEAEGGASGGGNSVWEVIGTVVRENPIIVWSIVAVVAALIIVGAVRRYHKVKRDERDDAASKK